MPDKMQSFCGTQITYSNANQTKRYDVGHRLGSGGFADVYAARSCDSQRVYACKVIKKSTIKTKKHAEKIKSELQIHSMCGIDNILENKYVVPFVRYWDDKDYIYILMSHCSNGSLDEWLKRRKIITEAEVRYITQEIALGVKYLHKKFNIIHRDLKLGNVLFDGNMTVKICDFGLAALLKVDETKKFTICGTPNYIAPEIASAINNSKGNQGHSVGVDIWAIGVIAFTLLYGKPPFETKNIAATCDKIKKSEFRFPKNSKLSEQGKDLIMKILTVDASQRASIKGILTHDFLKKLRVPSHLPASCLRERPSTEQLFGSSGKENEGGVMQRFNKACVNVVKFADYSAKYGVGYILSNGFTGILFNDSSSLILPITKECIYHIDMDKKQSVFDYQEFVDGKIEDVALKKRFDIFTQIAKHMWADFSLKNPTESKEPRDDVVGYISKWTRTKHAASFRFNDEKIPALFQDNTSVLLKRDGKAATSVMFIQPERNIFKQYASFTQFKEESSNEMRMYVHHIQGSMNGKK